MTRHLLTTFMTSKQLDDFDDDDNVESLITSNRARRDISMRAALPRDKTLSDTVKDMLRDAQKSEAQVDVFNPTFKGKLFEHNWLLDSLGDFYFNHMIADILSQVKGGKEANVYCCSAHPQLGPELLAAKVYRPRMFRNLKNDAAYRAGGAIKGEEPIAHEKFAVHPILKFPHIAWPLIAFEPCQCFGMQDFGRNAVFGRKAVNKVSRQKLAITLPFPQGRQLQVKNLQPVHQICTEQISSHQAFKGPIGRRDQADIRSQLTCAADRSVALVLKEAQQRDLSLLSQRINFIEKQRAAFSLSNEPATGCPCVGKRTTLMTEEFRLNQGVGQGAAVDRYKRLGASRPAVMDSASCKLQAPSQIPFRLR